MEKILNLIKKYIPRRLFKVLQPGYHFILSWLAVLVYRFPSERLIVIGITGTTGKTTSAYLIAKMLEQAGYKVGFTTTALFNDGQKEWLNDKKMTMVGRFFTQRILRRMLSNKCQYAIIETTSEGIGQFRHRFINYDILIFTGLYPEHIEAHGSFDKYKEVKGKLFAHLKRCRTKYANEKKYIHHLVTGMKKIELNRVKKIIIANLDDKEANYFIDFWAEEKLGYKKGVEGVGEKKEKEIAVFYNKVEVSDTGTSFYIHRKKINLQLLGEFNTTNAMNAVCLGLSQNLTFEKIKEGLEKISGVPGRFEIVKAGQNFTVIVDYAFEPGAVKKLYETVDLIPHNKIIHVLGSAGGGRDKARRPLLGKIAGQKANYVIITNEDPYDEDPQVIIDEVAGGAIKAGKKINENLFKILDRRKAIKKALSLAEEKDILIITGKGSEQAICIANGEKVPWDDRVVVKEELSHNM
ncbi:MAG: UDP-N-acetylmuramyl-tripeptide synthetase [Patescibacteria group bacterium]